MKAKEKAEELVQKYMLNTPVGFSIEDAKQCALIAVDLKLDSDFVFYSIEYGEASLKYWQEVKQEIEKL